MSKKWIITLSVLFGVLAVFLISLWTLFGLSTVSVEYNTTKTNLSVSSSEVVKVAGFKKHSCVLFSKKKDAVKRINDYAAKNENFAYIKVLNIETKFPNKFVVHIAEREELFAVQDGTSYLILDRDLRVLRKADTFESTSENAILLSGLTIKNQNVKVGDFLSTEEEGLKKLYSAFVKNNRSYGEQIGKFKQMSLSTYNDPTTHKQYVALTMLTFANRKFVLNNIDFALAEKVQKLYAVESTLYSAPTNDDGKFVDGDGNVLYVKKLDSGEYVKFDPEKHQESEKIAFGIDILQNCYIKIDNFTIAKYVNRSTKDIYYSIIEN